MLFNLNGGGGHVCLIYIYIYIYIESKPHGKIDSMKQNLYITWDCIPQHIDIKWYIRILVLGLKLDRFFAHWLIINIRNHDKIGINCINADDTIKVVTVCLLQGFLSLKLKSITICISSFSWNKSENKNTYNLSTTSPRKNIALIIKQKTSQLVNEEIICPLINLYACMPSADGEKPDTNWSNKHIRLL